MLILEGSIFNFTPSSSRTSDDPDFEDNFESFIESALDLPEQTVEFIEYTVLPDSRVDVQVLIEFTITLTQEEFDNTNFESENAIENALEDVENNIEDNGIEFIDGCTVPDACNYEPDATVNDGSCWYAMEYHDCDGNTNVDWEACVEDCDDFNDGNWFGSWSFDPVSLFLLSITTYKVV